MAFDTTQPSQMQGLNGYTVNPVFTVGDTINGYTPIGILDGTGAYELDADTVRVLVNHEVGSTAGYAYTLASGKSLTGARVSYFDIDKATFEVVDAGLAYDTIYNRAGEVVDADTALDTVDSRGISRLCGANLMEAEQFGADQGFADTIFFTGEETTGGTQFALDVATGNLWALPWLGRAAWESSTEVDTGTSTHVALLIGDDRSGARVDLNGDGDTADEGETLSPVAPTLLYVGTKDTSEGAGFLERNGLADGKLYVWVADDPDATDAIETSPADFFATGESLNGRFVEIDIYNPAGTVAVDGSDSGTSVQDGELGYDSLGFATQGQQDKMAIDAQAFLFSRPEDVATNPNDGTQVVLASTGNGAAAESDTWGTTYLIDLDFNNVATGDITAEFTILYSGDDAGGGAVAGGSDFGLRSPDNLDWADDGLIYLQEDAAVDTGTNAGDNTVAFGGASGEEASIWTIDPSAENPAATLTRVAQVDRSGLPATQTDGAPTQIGNWETSGVLDVSELFGNDPGELLIFDVQAHSITNGTIITATNIDGNNDGTRTANENLVQGGQLSFLIAPQATLVQDEDLVAATSGADVLDGGTEFDAVNDTVFTGAGNDEVDSTSAGEVAHSNRIFTGSGADTTYVADKDRAFGGSGNDAFFATDASGYRLSGGAGDDLFFLGVGGRALGGDGDDTFYVGESGGNTLSGGAGADAFWILNDDAALLGTPNTIVDFTKGTDILGIAAQGAGFDFTDLSFSGSNILVGTTTIATLTGVTTSTLTATDFVFSASAISV